MCGGGLYLRIDVLWTYMWLLEYVCVYDDTFAAWQIWGLSQEYMCSDVERKSRYNWGFDRIKTFLCVVMILAKGQIYHHHCIMKKMNVFDLTRESNRQKWMLDLKRKNNRRGGNIVVLRDMVIYCNILWCIMQY